MKVLILAAGYGTRLYAIIKDKPKALLEIKGKTLLDYILDRIEGANHLDEVLVITNEKFYGQIQAWADERTNFSVPIKVLNDHTLTPEERLGSIGDIEFAIKEENIKDDLLVVGGDNLFDFNIQEYIIFAQKRSDAVSIGLYDIENINEANKFGVVALDQNKKVTSFEEKPAKPKSSLIAMCFYYLPKSTLGSVAAYLKQTEKSDTAGDYIRWLCEKKDVYGFKFKGKWYDIGSVESYHEAQKNFPSR